MNGAGAIRPRGAGGALRRGAAAALRAGCAALGLRSCWRGTGGGVPRFGCKLPTWLSVCYVIEYHLPDALAVYPVPAPAAVVAD